MNRAFWAGRRVFLTGHTGFKGSWLSLMLQEAQAEVTGYALPPPTKPSLFEEASVATGMRSIIGDIRDQASLFDAVQQSRPEIVLHLAAQPLVGYSYSNPIETYATNVMGTVHLLEAVRQIGGVRAVVNVTTDKCYENREWSWPYRENERLGGHDPYSNSKACSELVSACFRNSFFSAQTFDSHGVGLATARAGNVIGGGDWADNRLIPDILAAFARGEPAGIRSPTSVRPWQHVLEPLAGYTRLAELLHEQGPRFAQAWNFGPRAEDARPVSWIADKMADLWGDGASWANRAALQHHEAGQLRLDSTSAMQELNWQPRLHLEEALKLTTEWAKRRMQGADIRALTLDQIRHYGSLTHAD
ncbi:CDP-glucose 4,6-dehydratase [Herbaspirillum aquaticum]|jgi:CDP-glucose 4,6-dehydratase|uniref:CDP-glucose 4,6-dehydratase n=1 Tax=Herbaspirillum aquaticum TaxID=568783 RepID=UPI0024DE6B04|nr:CDP-glucose 4,6-dehydratase [Herbaspirillum aquaticum]